MKVETVELGQTGIDCVEIGLLHVRAADNIRIVYDFTRDGYVVLQASRYAWKADDSGGYTGWCDECVQSRTRSVIERRGCVRK